MSVSDWSATANENTSIDGINIAEHCPAKNMNDALRAVMAALKNKCDALDSTDNTLRLGAVIGEVRWFAMSTPPEGWLVCNGAAVGRATYPELFAAIGTIYGTGDGSTTFNLPNLTNKFIQGSNTVGTVKSAGLPNITGFGGSFFGGGAPASGALNKIPITEDLCEAQLKSTTTPSYTFSSLGFNASSSNNIYGNSDTVQPPALCLLPCIRYE